MTAGIKPTPPKPELAIRLDSLKALLLSGPVFNFSDLQAALGVDRRTAKRAIRLLVACGLLDTNGPPKAPVTSLRYNFTPSAQRLLWNQTGLHIPQRHIREVREMFFERVATMNRDATDLRVLSVSLSASTLDPNVASHEFIETEIRIEVNPRRGGVYGMKALIKSLLSVGDRSLKVSLILQSASDDCGVTTAREQAMPSPKP